MAEWKYNNEFISPVLSNFRCILFKKEVKKLRPYLETKIVKVKKKKEYSNQIIIDGRKYTLCEEEYLHKEKGNWVNGENLDKIKFPCFCSFNYGNEMCYGEINSNREKSGDKEYTMTNLTEQTKGLSIVYGYNSLKRMIEELKVKIKPGKIIIYEEER